MTNDKSYGSITKVSKTPAAIAQSVVRILGKDEVTSSILVSSSQMRPYRIRLSGFPEGLIVSFHGKIPPGFPMEKDPGGAAHDTAESYAEFLLEGGNVK